MMCNIFGRETNQIEEAVSCVVEFSHGKLAVDMTQVPIFTVH